jgi:hypothetical protein
VQWYPKPLHDNIKEVFAGSAQYSLKYFDRDITIIDKNPKIVAIWKWLQFASEKDILGLPDIPANLDTNYLNLSEAERDFLGFQWNPGNAYPCRKIGNYRNTDPLYWKKQRAVLSVSLYKIKHWEICCGDYSNTENTTKSTWFIDPPYQFGGNKYPFGVQKINHSHLRDWILSLKGQVIVCENAQANWMNFTPLVNIQGASNKPSTECIWTGVPRSIQSELFTEKTFETT